MSPRWPAKWRFASVATVLLLAAAAVKLWPASLESEAARVRDEVAAIRGLAFERPVAVSQLSRDQARAFIVGESSKVPRIEDYWAVMRTVGLYRGADREAPEFIFGGLSDFAGGAYDAYHETLLMFGNLDVQERRSLLAHEMYHALQDQHFDLKRYMLDRSHEPGANMDELLARQAVVEGEALYMATIYQVRDANGSLPTRAQLGSMVTAQLGWNPDQWKTTIRDPSITKEQRARLQMAIDARNRLPPFMFELFIRAYIDGMVFIHAVYEKGWPEVEKLYREHPPESTEQILHPEKWFARERPVNIAWPAFEFDPLFTDWHLLHENVLGERQWQVVFAEQGLGSEAKSVAAGWNGDRYAVFKRNNDGALLMLVYTSWDTAEDAAEFAAAYGRLLQAKYRDVSIPTRVRMKDAEVLIVEGGSEEMADAFMSFNGRAVLSGQ